MKKAVYIKDNIVLDANAPKKADIAKSQKVVEICTEYAQKGMINIFIAIFCFPGSVRTSAHKFARINASILEGIGSYLELLCLRGTHHTQQQRKY